MKTTVNLLPVSCQLRQEHRRQARLWLGIGGTLMGLMVLVHLGMSTSDQLLKARLAEWETRVEPVRVLHAEMQQLQRRSQVQRERLQWLAGLAQADVPLAVLQVLGNAGVSVNHEVQLDFLRVDETVVTPSPTANAPGMIRKNIVLSGKADGDASLAGFVSALRAADFFQAVDLESIQAASQRDRAQRSFQICCLLEVPQTGPPPAKDLSSRSLGDVR